MQNEKGVYGSGRLPYPGLRQRNMLPVDPGQDPFAPSKTIGVRERVTGRDDVPGLVTRLAPAFSGLARQVMFTPALPFLIVQRASWIQLRVEGRFLGKAERAKQFIDHAGCQVVEIHTDTPRTFIFEHIPTNTGQNGTFFNRTSPAGLTGANVNPGPGRLLVVGPWVTPIHVWAPENAALLWSVGAVVIGANFFGAQGRHPSFPLITPAIIAPQPIAALSNGAFAVGSAPQGLPIALGRTWNGDYRLTLDLDFPGSVTLAETQWLWGPSKTVDCKQELLERTTTPGYIFTDGQHMMVANP